MGDPAAVVSTETPTATPAKAEPAKESDAKAAAVQPAEPKTDGKPTDQERFAELAAQQKRLASERMKLAHEARKFREEQAKYQEQTAKDRADFEAWKKAREDRHRNPEKYLTAEYGADWYDKFSKIKLHGGTTPDLVASEVDERVGGVEKKLMSEVESLRKELADRDRQHVAQQKAEYEQAAVRYAQANAEKYPLIEAFGVAENIPAFIEAHYVRTSEEDENGNRVNGEVLTAEQAADMLEKMLAPKFEAALKKKQLQQAPSEPQSKPSDRVQSSTRRLNLSTDLTGTSSSDQPPPQNEGERIKRAIARWDSVSSNNR